MSDTEMTAELDDDAPTQALIPDADSNVDDQGDDSNEAPTQALTQNIGDNEDDSYLETQPYQPETQMEASDAGYAETQALADETAGDEAGQEQEEDEEQTQAIEQRSRSVSRERSKSRSRSGSPAENRSKSRSRSRSKSGSRSRSRSGSADSRKSGSRSPSGDRSRSRSKSKSKSRSGSRSRSRSGSRSKSRSRSKSGSRSKSRSRSKSGSRSKSRSRSRSGSSRRSRSGSRSVSRSRSRSRSKSGSGSDSDVEAKKKKVVKDAFGDSDEEGEKENGEGAPALPAVSDSDGEGDDNALPKPVAAATNDDSSDDERPSDRGGDGGFTSNRLNDFDAMMEKKRMEMKKRRKKKDIDLINDNDDAIARLIADMRVAAREDRDLNEAKAPAIKKIAMLPLVMTQLRKADLQMAFVEANVLSVMTDWLAPMPDRSLPSLKIRQELLKLLLNLKIDDQSRLKESGIGKAVMYLYKHPRELKENKLLAGKIINNWARPIFNKSSDYRDYDKDERRGRDVELVARKRRQEEAEEQEEALRPGDPGWIARARVPMPASYQYVKRPKWQNDVDIAKGKQRKEVTKLDKHIRAQQERKRMAKSNRRAVEISIEGRKTAL